MEDRGMFSSREQNKSMKTHTPGRNKDIVVSIMCEYSP